MKLDNLSDQQLLKNADTLAKQEREILVQVLWHLAEIQRRKLFAPKHSSLFEYAVSRLGYSEDQAARRISAMRLLVELPEIETQVSSGKLTLTALGMAQTFFRTEKTSATLPSLTDHKPPDASSAQYHEPETRQDIERATVAARSTKLETLKLLEGKSTREASQILVEMSSTPEKLRPETVRPISMTTSELRLVVKDVTLDKISRLKGLLAHRHPHLSTADLLEIICDLAIEKLNPAKGPTRKNPVNDPKLIKQLSSRRPTAALRRTVWHRAGSCCEKCGSTHMLEIDHIIPYAQGGSTSIENLRLLCRNCNQRASIRLFGVHSHKANLGVHSHKVKRGFASNRLSLKRDPDK